MAQDYTIEEIQKEFLFVRGDIEELERTIGKVFDTLRDAAKEKKSDTSDRVIQIELTTAEKLAKDLVQKLAAIEDRLMAQARLSRRAAAGGS